MAKFDGWRSVWAVLLACAASTIAALGQNFTTLVSFELTDGANPEYEALVQGTDGNFYGTTELGGKINQYCNGGTTCGTVFKVSPGGALTTLHRFKGADGYYPSAGLVLSTDGNFYGTTFTGGPDYYGTVFKITPAGTLTTLHSFTYTDGDHPNGGTLVQDADGEFYGTTTYGGANKQGTVFRITPSGRLTTLYSFCVQSNCTDGEQPIGGLVQAVDGNFYGAASFGGTKNSSCPYGCGTVFKITPKGKLTTLHSFDSSDGAIPNGLVQAVDGNLYGATGAGGAYTGGTVFRITSGGKLTTLYNFCAQSNCTDGAGPWWPVQATDGNFYGATSTGGAYGYGTVFRITSGGKLTTLYNFCAQFNCTDGWQPSGGLLQATNGKFYGTTWWGGEILDPACGIYPPFHGCGTVYSMSVGLKPFVQTNPTTGKVAKRVFILGTNLAGATSVTFNGVAAKFTIISKSEITTSVPYGATTGKVNVTTPYGTLVSNVNFRVIR
jgi:uncharacterized repeat protein (TIGR03803 family)